MADPTFSYVVMAHNPAGILRLVRRIRTVSPDAHVLVRFEHGSDFDIAALDEAGAIPLASRIPVRWGTWSLTEAMLEALGRARTLTPADHFVLVSGQDYPVRDLPVWEREWAAGSADALLDPIVDHPEDYRYRWSVLEPPIPARLRRVTRHVGWRLGTWTRPVVQILPRFTPTDNHWIVGVRRLGRPPAGVPVTKCSQWMTLSRRAVDHVLHVDRTQPQVRRFFRTVRISDESYVQSILNSAPELLIRHGETTAKHFEPGASSPVWLDVETLDAVTRSSRAPFARKFAPDAPDAVFDRADDLASRDLQARDLIGH